MPQPAAAVQIDRTAGATAMFVRYTVRDAAGLVASIGVRAEQDSPDLALYLEAFFEDHPTGPVRAAREPGTPHLRLA